MLYIFNVYCSNVVYDIQHTGCQPEKNYFTSWWPFPLVVCWRGSRIKKVLQRAPPHPMLPLRRKYSKNQLSSRERIRRTPQIHEIERTNYFDGADRPR